MLRLPVVASAAATVFAALAARLRPLAVAFVAALAALVSPPVTGPAAAADPNLVLERDLTGTWTGTGFFSNVLGQRRDFVVTFDGRSDGDTLRLGEIIRFADGAVERYTWVFTRTGPTTYTGTREGVVGTARVTAAGNRVTLEYTADVKDEKGQTSRVRFEDVLIKRSDRTILNTAAVFLGPVQVGRVEIVIRR